MKMQLKRKIDPYNEEALKFLEDTNSTMSAKFLNHGKHFDDDEKTRDIYLIILRRNGEAYSFNFGQSIANSNITGHNRIKPTAYDVLTCLTKYDPGTFEDFCGDFGYDTDSKKAEKTYNAVRDEFLNLERLFTPKQMEELQEIQ